MDQSFSAENFRKIFDYANRLGKGMYLEKRFFKELLPLTYEIKECNKLIRQLRKNKRNKRITKANYRVTLNEILEKKNRLKEEKEVKLTAALKRVSDEATLGQLDVGLTAGKNEINGRIVYTAGRDAKSYFALKQVQYNIRRLYKVKQGNKHNITSQIREILCDDLPKYFIRTDLSSFYESIPQGKLLAKIASDHYFTLPSLRLIKQVLYEYKKYTGCDGDACNEYGLPRGVGISAYLSELYMRDFDEELKAHEGVIFHARYVDDIFIVYVPNPNNPNTSAIKSHIDSVITKHGFTKRQDKTIEKNVDKNNRQSIDFLGYNYSFGDGDVKIDITDKKRDKYIEKLKLSFDRYSTKPTYFEKRLLLKRIKFLTGNTRLYGNKRRASTGIYFSNSLLNTFDKLKVLDQELLGHINLISDGKFRDQLSALSFVCGFKTVRFHHFSTRALSKIVKVWKNVS